MFDPVFPVDAVVLGPERVLRPGDFNVYNTTRPSSRRATWGK